MYITCLRQLEIVLNKTVKCLELILSQRSSSHNALYMHRTNRQRVPSIQQDSSMHPIFCTGSVVDSMCFLIHKYGSRCGQICCFDRDKTCIIQLENKRPYQQGCYQASIQDEVSTCMMNATCMFIFSKHTKQQPPLHHMPY